VWKFEENWVDMIQSNEYSNTDGSIDVAVKRLPQYNEGTDLENFYRRMKTTLGEMKKLNNKHLIRAIATYTKGKDRCFMFPWANGGNLEAMLRSDQRKVNKELINWVVDQIVGLFEGIMALHGKSIRHGAIKPSNILCFGPGPRTSNESILMIADIGLTEQHITEFMLTKKGPVIYEPPEASLKNQLTFLSRKYDVWSLGCLCLELIIWAVYGVNGIRSFHEDLSQNPDPRFWEDSRLWGGQKIHSAVEKRIKKLKKDLKNVSALSDLIKLIEERLLIISVDKRADSKEVCTRLKTIEEKISGNSEYLFNFQLEKLAASRDITI
jgi:serine/threonine protein kinase